VVAATAPLSPLAQALYWREIYAEIVNVEERFIAQMRDLMVGLSYEAQRALELNNVAPVLRQIEKCQKRRQYWDACVGEFEGGEPTPMALQIADLVTPAGFSRERQT
jgi:hypothetical protein